MNRIGTLLLLTVFSLACENSGERGSKRGDPSKQSEVSGRWLPPGYINEQTCIGKTLSKILESKDIDESHCKYYDFTPGLLSAIAMPVGKDDRWLIVGFHPPPLDLSRKWSAASLENDHIVWAYSRLGKPQISEIVLQ